MLHGSPQIATRPEETRDFYPEATTITYYYRILPNNNPEHPNGVAPLVWAISRLCPEKAYLPSTWCPTFETAPTARQLAVEEILADAKHHVGPWNIRVVEWERRADWGIDS